ncbi:MAG: FAD/NAD(P)-binding protein [Spirochaetota bacterium]|nr:FAD/NAD(P)-binding protein [Spirochaetota bacterium]
MNYHSPSFIEFETGYAPIPAEIVNIEKATEKEKVFTLKLPGNQKLNYLPCQFVMVSVFGFGEAPISICSGPEDNELKLCIRNVGSLTGHIHKMNIGDFIGIRGPYGNGFPVEAIKSKDILLVAGGLGLAPLRSLIRYILANRSEFGKFMLLYGSKKISDRLFTSDIEDWNKLEDIDFHETVDVADQTWEGNIGLITQLFKFIDPDPKNTVGVVVGPPVMYRFVIREMLNKKLHISQIYMDLERRMRCGMGKCGHCQINEIFVCQKGPVFNYAEMIELNLKEAL